MYTLVAQVNISTYDTLVVAIYNIKKMIEYVKDLRHEERKHKENSRLNYIALTHGYCQVIGLI